MSIWLSVSQALALIGRELADVDEAAFEGALAGACTFVEERRSDLFVTVLDEDDVEVTTFEADPAVRLGTAMLANRFYERRSSPLGAAQYTEFGAGTILRYDPDIARLLLIGTEGKFNFGAAGYVPSNVVEDVV